jgi:hypothetical protein
MGGRALLDGPGGSARSGPHRGCRAGTRRCGGAGQHVGVQPVLPVPYFAEFPDQYWIVIWTTSLDLVPSCLFASQFFQDGVPVRTTTIAYIAPGRFRALHLAPPSPATRAAGPTAPAEALTAAGPGGQCIDIRPCPPVAGIASRAESS